MYNKVKGNKRKAMYTQTSSLSVGIKKKFLKITKSSEIKTLFSILNKSEQK